MKRLKNKTKVWVTFKTLHNSKYYQADMGNSPTHTQGEIVESYQYENKGPEWFYTVKFDVCTKYGLSREKLEVRTKTKKK